MRCPARPAAPPGEAGGGAQPRHLPGSLRLQGCYSRAVHKAPVEHGDRPPVLSSPRSAARCLSCPDLGPELLSGARVQLSHLNQCRLDERDASHPDWRLCSAGGASSRSRGPSACCPVDGDAEAMDMVALPQAWRMFPTAGSSSAPSHAHPHPSRACPHPRGPAAPFSLLCHR